MSDRGNPFTRPGDPAFRHIRAFLILAAALLFGGGVLLAEGGVQPSRQAALVTSTGTIYVPAGAHQPGQNGTNWRTDVEVHNPGSDTARYSVSLLLQNQDNSSPQSQSFSLPPQQSIRYPDILSTVFGVTGAGALRIIPSAGTILVTSRTYNLIDTNPFSLPVGASFGQFVPGFLETDAIGYGEEGRLIQLTQQPAATLDSFRTNVGLVNTTSLPIGVTIDLYKADGTYLGTRSGSDTSLLPYGFRQLNQIFSAFGTVADGYAVVKTTTPGGRLLAFASVNDNHNSGDPIFVPVMKTPGSGPFSPVIWIPASAHAPGKNGANWRTDLEVHNPSTSAVTFTIDLLMQDADNGGTVPSRTGTLGPGQAWRYGDVISTLFGTSGAAALRITSPGGALLVNSRTYNLIGANTVGLPVGASFGQYVPGLTDEDAIADGEEGRLVQLTNRDASTLSDFRTNIGLVNATAQTLDVTVDFYGSDGTLLGTLSGSDTQLRPYGFRQLNAPILRFTSWCPDGYAVVTPATRGGKIFAFASVNDNHLTGDPIFVPAARIVPTGPLALFAPTLAGLLLSGVPATIVIPARNVSGAPLTFSLVQGPSGATLDTSSGVMTWTPPASAEGTSVPIHVSATDGTATADVTFSLSVASSTPATSTLSGSTLTVTQGGTLQGVSLTFPSQVSPAPGLVTISTVPDGQIPPIPDGIVRVSDFFRVTPTNAQGTDPITVSIPAKLVPSTVKPYNMRLFTYTDRTDGDGGPAWVPTAYRLNVLQDGTVTIRLFALGELSFFGYWASAATASGAAEERSIWSPPVRLDFGQESATVSCQPWLAGLDRGVPGSYICSVTGDVSMTVTVRSFDPNPWIPAATGDQLVGWLVAAKLKFATYGMTSAPDFEVILEPMPKPTWLGFVDGDENRRVLHLTNAVEPRDFLQGTAVHEYFHHSQGETRVSGKASAIIDLGEDAKWLYEGTARWFEDEVFDSLDTYKVKEPGPLGAILSRGLNAFDTSDNVNPPRDALTRSYSRFGFFKMVSSHCPGLDLVQAFNVDGATDPTGIVGFASGLASAGWGCNFDLGFGSANKASLASALLSYLFATQKADDISLLDSNESGHFFKPPGITLTPADVGAGPLPPSAGGVPWRLRPAAATAVLVNPVAVADPTKQVALEADIGSPPVWVWVGDTTQIGSLAGGTWWNTAGTKRYVYGLGGSAPGLFVAIVNPSTAATAPVTLRTSIRPPVSCTGSYRDSLWAGDAVQGSYPVWTATSQGAVSSPRGLNVTSSWSVSNDIGTCSVNVSGNGGTPPYNVTLSGSLQAAPDQMSGSVKVNFGQTLTWTYSNPRLVVDYPSGAAAAGSAFSYTLSVPAPNFRRTVKVCILYDEVATLTAPNGTVLSTDQKLADPKACISYGFVLNLP